MPLAKVLKRDGCGGIAGDDNRLHAACYQLVAELFGKRAHLGIAPRAEWMTCAIADIDGGFGGEARLHFAQDAESADPRIKEPDRA